jgi:hypothetical protein
MGEGWGGRMRWKEEEKDEVAVEGRWRVRVEDERRRIIWWDKVQRRWSRKDEEWGRK